MAATPPQLDVRFDPHARPVPADTLERLAAFATKWQAVSGNEQQLAQAFLIELCDALGTPRPYDEAHASEDYRFEKLVSVPLTAQQGRIDLYKRDHFVLEAKCGRNTSRDPGSAPVRNTHSWQAYIQNAYEGQARFYAGLLPEGPPPALIVVDIGHHIWVWPRRNDAYPDYYSPHRLDFPLTAISDERNARILLDCFESPQDLDRGRLQTRVTEEAAERLAALAAQLRAHHDPRDVARFLMRCIFCMFAEDVDLLHDFQFTNLLSRARRHPPALEAELTRLFAAMDTGGTYDFIAVRRFNGALFQDARALPLDAAAVQLLSDLAGLDWSQVDPSIFGTLLERALSPRERHSLGAHYTPRAFVERLVARTIDEPLRRAWDAIQTHVQDLLGAAEKTTPALREAAMAAATTFHDRLRRIHVLDPACGTGNFLVVAYASLKALEYEVLEFMRALGGAQQGLALAGSAVVPEHFLGIELNPWAAEIAQLVLWMAHLQWEIHHGGAQTITDPVLSSNRSIQCHDALITAAKTVPRVGPDGPQMRWDGLTFMAHPVTGKEVPDPTAVVPVVDLEGVTVTPWPRADFIVGNPPFIGNKRMREALGDATVEAIRKAYPALPDTLDFVMYWWHRAAELVRKGDTQRFGLITTNSLSQTFNRKVVEAALDAEPALELVHAIADHPWVELGAAVRIAMTVGERKSPDVERMAQLGTVTAEDDTNVTVEWRAVPRIHADLTGGADVTAAVPLQANANLSFQGMNLVGKGFRLTAEQVEALGYDLGNLPPIIRPHLNAMELMRGRLEKYVIDAFGLTEPELKTQYPAAWQWLYDHVKPERDQNRRAGYREKWWLIGESRGRLRRALGIKSRFIATGRVSKHRVFVMLPAVVVPDCKLIAITTATPHTLAILSSAAHVNWGLAAGGRLGVGNDPSYDNTRCFETFPFPDLTPTQEAELSRLGEALDAWRWKVLDTHPDVHLTLLYNIVEKLRSGETLTKAELAVHRRVGTSALVELHAAIDKVVLEAYGFTGRDDAGILEGLAALNASRAAEEAAGRVRSLNDCLLPKDAEPTPGSRARTKATKDPKVAKVAWPKDPIDQIAAVLGRFQRVDATASGLLPETVIASFTRAPKDDRIPIILNRLHERGLLLRADTGAYRSI